MVVFGALTSAGPSDLRSFVLRPTACAEASRSPWVRRADNCDRPVTSTRSATDGNRDFAAGGQLSRRACLTVLHSRSKRSRTYDFHQTRPRGEERCTARLRAGFPPHVPLSRRCRVPSVRAPGVHSPFCAPCQAHLTPRSQAHASFGMTSNSPATERVHDRWGAHVRGCANPIGQGHGHGHVYGPSESTSGPKHFPRVAGAFMLPGNSDV